MALTSWAVLYFRSLKVNSVFQQLTTYLIHYRRVSIPGVGTIQLVQQPAQLAVADKCLLPPTCVAQLLQNDTVPEHQLSFLSALLHQDKAGVQQSLEELGRRISGHMEDDGFHWTGIGHIRKAGFDSALPAGALEPVAADKVFRSDAAHPVLVGDQQLTLAQLSGRREEEVPLAKRYSIYMLIGWILLLLSILYIVFVLYQGKFRLQSTGSKQPAVALVQGTAAADTGKP